MPARALIYTPIRKRMQGSVFGSAPSVWKSIAMEHELFPAHSRALQKSRLVDPVADFVHTVQHISVGQMLDKIQAYKSDEIIIGLVEWVTITKIGLVEWVTITMFMGATSAILGRDDNFWKAIDLTPEAFRRQLIIFDHGFPLLASGVVPQFLTSFIKPVHEGLAVRKFLAGELEKWIQQDLTRLAENLLMRELVRVSTEAGWSTSEAALVLVADIWALQANAPSVAAWCLLYILQSAGLVEEMIEEINRTKDQAQKEGLAAASFKNLTSFDALPLLTSCLVETLRLVTSSFSIRDVEETFVLRHGRRSKRGDDILPAGLLIPKGSNIICATSAAHLDETVWDKAQSWDGKRFFDRIGEQPGTRSSRGTDVRGFGGGISVCEGRNLAMAELKAFFLVVFSSLDFTITTSVNTNAVRSLGITDAPVGLRPDIAAGRVGLGAYQFGKNDMIVTVRRRT